MDTLAGRFIAFCWITFCIVWLVAALRTKRTIISRGPRGLWWVGVLGVLGVLRLLTRSGTGLFSMGSRSHTRADGVLAIVITLAGLALAVWARVMLGGNWS